MELLEKASWQRLMRLADGGSHEAQYEAGYYHEHGTTDEAGHVLAEASISEALRWYTLAAAQGNQHAQNALCTIHSSDEGLPRDFQAAIRWGKKAVAQGNASAAFNLATIYRDRNNPRMAFRWYERAVALGDSGALLATGLCYLFAYGVRQDADSAYRCFERLLRNDPLEQCQRDREDARYWMALIHLVGMGSVRKSVPRARELLEAANGDDDHEQANAILNVIGKTRYLPRPPKEGLSPSSLSAEKT